MKNGRPRILYFSPYWPHRATCASELRALNVARALRELGEVEFVIVGGEEKGEEWLATSEKEFPVACAVNISSRRDRGLRQMIRWTFDPRMPYPHGCGVDEQATARVLQLVQQFDLLWFCKLRTPNMFPHWEWPRSVADIDDVPSTFERSVWRTETDLARRFAAARGIFSWRRRDELLGDRFNVLTVCSETDKQYLQSLGVKSPLYVVPNGFEQPNEISRRKPANPPRLGFIGIFDYEPNLEGIRWFASKCWPLIKRAVPNARLRLIGRYSDGPLKPFGPDIDGLGFLPDVKEEIATWSAMVVPVTIGAGTRGKIAHAFSLKCPVVSTTYGVYGYDVQNGREIYLADSPEAFAQACVKTIREPADASAVAERAWQRFLEKWTWEAIGPSIRAAAEDCLRRNGSSIS